MKIKNRILLQFNLVVTVILLLVCLSVYYASEMRRQTVLDKKLRNRSFSTINRLLTIEEIDQDLLRKIDESTYVTIYEKSLVVYDASQREIYTYADSNVTAIRLTANDFTLIALKSDNEYAFDRGRVHALAGNYFINKKRYTVVSAAFDADGLERLTELKKILLISFVSCVLITFISGLFFSYNIVTAIKKIADELKAISSKNLANRILLPASKDELYDLSNTFNELLARLEASFQTQKHFITNASHELNTPLTAVSSQLEVALQQDRTVEEYRKVLLSIHEDVQNLNQLTRSLLDMAKASGASAGMDLEPVRIDELLLKLPNDLHRIDKQYQVKLNFMDFPEDEKKIVVFGNANLIYIALKNLVVNACKYGTDHTALVTLQFVESFINILITDNGPGIRLEEQQLVFEPFYRSATSKNQSGFGLGLPLAAKIIKLHKGEIKLLATNREGAQLFIQLPTVSKFEK